MSITMSPFDVWIVTVRASPAARAAGALVGHAARDRDGIGAALPSGDAEGDAAPKGLPIRNTAAPTRTAAMARPMTTGLYPRLERPVTRPPRTAFGRTPDAARFAARFWARVSCRARSAAASAPPLSASPP